MLEAPIKISEKELLQELSEIILEKIKTKEGYQALFNFVDKELTPEFGRQELQKYKMFHILIGSTLEPEASLKLDLPGNIIEKFIRERL
ncbi:MAG: hypothetical protein WCO12_02085 [bacterium]